MSRKIQDKINKDNKKRLLKSFPYGQGDVLKNKKYLKDRNDLLRKNGNGWWYGLNKEQKIALGIKLTEEEKNE